MIMFPIQYLQQQQQQQQQRQHYDCVGGFGEGNYTGSFNGLMRTNIQGYDNCYSEVCLESSSTDHHLVVLVGDHNHHMAEDWSRTSSVTEAAGSSSKDVVVGQQQDIDQNKDEKWLQLCLGNSSSSVTDSELKLNPVLEEPMAGRGRLVELDLLSSSTTPTQDMKSLAPMFHMSTEFGWPGLPRPPITQGGGGGGGGGAGTNISMPFLFQQQQQQQRTSLDLSHHHQPDRIEWGSSYRPNIWNPTLAASSSSVPVRSYFSSQSFHQHSNMDIAGPSSEMTTMMKVVDTPPRPLSGIWFVLQASQNQSKEPFLPQIPKSYLRIKDGTMTVRLLMKYLVNKLRLNSESEIEIRCRGQELEPSLTLQHVRDNIWNSKDMVTLLPDSSTLDHVMILHYGWTTTFSSSPPI